MTKNMEKELKNTPATSKNLHLTAWGGFLLLICLGLCISYDLHQTKLISSEILPQMQADYEAKIADLNAEITILERKFNKLQSEHLSVDALSEEYVDTKLEEFKQSILNATPKTEDEKILQNNTKIAALEKAVVDLQQDEKVVPQEILLAAGALTIRSMAENGENFSYEAEVLQIMAQGNDVAEQYIEKMKTFADKPITNKNALIKDFKRIYADVSGTEIPNRIERGRPAIKDQSWKDAFLRRLKNMVTFKSKKTAIKFEPQPDEVYDLVENGNLALAIERMKTDNKYVLLQSQVFRAWMYNAQNYLDFNNAVNGLLMNTLAHLHLKQFEHNEQ